MDLLLLWSGIKLGAFFSLLALSYYLVHRCTGVMSFATGAYAMVGAMVFASLAGDVVPTAVAVPAALVAAAVVSVVAETAVVRPISRSAGGELGAVLAMVATLFVIEQLCASIFGRIPLSASRLSDERWEVLDVGLNSHDVFAVSASAVVLLVVAVWLSRGRYGRMARAVGDSEPGAVAMGLPVTRVRVTIAALAGAVAGVAGVFYVPQTGVNFQSATYFAVAGFLALAIGGTGAAWGALIGGVLLGMVEVYGVVLVGSAARDYLFLAVLIGIFAIRPQGILAIRERV
jgi:branched-chain amino acid transport system permease protein